MNLKQQCAERKGQRERVRNKSQLKGRRETSERLKMQKLASSYVWSQSKATIRARIGLLPVMDYRKKRAAIKVIIDQELSS